jgi:glutamate-1-semialdehyde aminotransferase
LDIIDFRNYSLAPAACNAGVPLIFDEIVSGFRYAPGGAQEKYSVTPDLACVAKIVAGYVGKRRSSCSSCSSSSSSSSSCSSSSSSSSFPDFSGERR